MIEKEVTVTIENGLHARPAAQLVQQASQYQSKLELVIGQQRINAKSILHLMSVAISEGQTIKVMVDGEDEQEAWTFIASFLQPGNESTLR
ncbi:HPr family phosphocarrier protein [Anoxybacillus rupiensis]|jgi:phosphotransferase system HPr (HPr) family protein|uniref:Phosphocarrier protein HPr n=1 Tax=Anoxybacteroides rupiense TaxID=311460 RepID=A0ABT5W7G2_9BACL|nr:HPr family phosphocarrier protein [Anoxybacillus rupiensis]MDE8565278.1 HPr family phosphocarrier protein [Anoxybacillus rupiensis]